MIESTSSRTSIEYSGYGMIGYIEIFSSSMPVVSAPRICSSDHVASPSGLCVVRFSALTVTTVPDGSVKSYERLPARYLVGSALPSAPFGVWQTPHTST